MSHKNPGAPPPKTPACDYCGQPSLLVTGEIIYPHRPDLASKLYYQCKPCDAHVGCHPGTHVPMGRLANLELRQAKQLAHAWFDRRWSHVDGKSARFRARSAAYAWLAQQLGKPIAETHIGMFTTEECLRVVDACKADPVPAAVHP